MNIQEIEQILGEDAESLLAHNCKTISADQLVLPGPDFVENVMAFTDRPAPVLRNFQTILNTGRLGGTGFVSILPVDQGIEHSAGASFAPKPSPRRSACSARRRAATGTRFPTS